MLLKRENQHRRRKIITGITNATLGASAQIAEGTFRLRWSKIQIELKLTTNYQKR